MNILFCGDSNIEDGLLIAVASLRASTKKPLRIRILTLEMSEADRAVAPVCAQTASYLDAYLKETNPESSVSRIDMTERFRRELPAANLDTRFTPCCMLRLFADEIEEIPDRILYLDTDVICREGIDDFYEQDLEDFELAGVLDYYGRWFFRRNPFHMDYLNSGVMLFNMAAIRRSGLFARCRERCRTKKMFMPDQSALNKLAAHKKICERKYNEQRMYHPDTVIQHFTTGFRFVPWPHTLTVKPWQIEQVHDTLQLFAYDEILTEYTQMKSQTEKGRQDDNDTHILYHR